MQGTGTVSLCLHIKVKTIFLTKTGPERLVWRNRNFVSTLDTNPVSGLQLSTSLIATLPYKTFNFFLTNIG